jgi:hypothetical protein
MLTQEALNPFVECTSGLVGGEGLSITLKLGMFQIGSRPRAHARARSKNYAYQNWSARS